MTIWLKDNGVKKTITDEQLIALMEKVVPVVYHVGKHFLIQEVDARRMSYLWSPKHTKEVSFEHLVKVEVDFPCGYYGFFKPSIAEVLAWFPHENSEGINSFCIENDVIDIYESGEFQRAEVIFGRCAKNE